MKRLVFFHNTLPEYRVEFWNNLGKRCKLIVAVIEPELQNKVYGLKIGNVYFEVAHVKNRKEIETIIDGANAVVLPPIDDAKCILSTVFIKRVCKQHNIPFYFWTEKWQAPDSITPLKKKVKNYIQQKIYSYCSSGSEMNIASGKKAAAYLNKIGIKKESIRLVIDSSTSPNDKCINIKEKWGIDKNKRIILYFGRLIERKGCDVLIKACKENLERWNAVLMIAGEGPFMKQCKEIANNKTNIIFTGIIQPIDRRSYYSQSDIFVLPSIISEGVVEGWGLSVNEALECGTPVICTNAVGSAFDLVNAKTGLMVNQADIIALRKGISRLLNSHISREKIIIEYSKNSVSKMAEGFYRTIFE